MPFDIDGARKAGYSDAEITSYLADDKSLGFDVAGAQKAGYSPTEIVGFLQQNPEPAEPAKPGLLEDLPTGVPYTAKKVGAIGLDVVNWLERHGLDADKQSGLRDSNYDDTKGQQELHEAATNLRRSAEANPPQRWTGQLSSGLMYAPFGAAAPLVVGMSEGTARSQSLQDAGVDQDTADRAGAVTGLTQAGVQMLPLGNLVFGEGAKAIASSTAKAAVKSGAAGAAQQVVDDVATQQMLKNAGYDEQAKQFAPSLEKAAEAAAFNAGVHLGTQGAHRIAHGNPVHNEIASEIANSDVAPAADAEVRARLDPQTYREDTARPQEAVAPKDQPLLTPTETTPADIAKATTVDEAIQAATESVPSINLEALQDDAVASELFKIRPLKEAVKEAVPEATKAEDQTAMQLAMEDARRMMLTPVSKRTVVAEPNINEKVGDVNERLPATGTSVPDGLPESVGIDTAVLANQPEINQELAGGNRAKPAVESQALRPAGEGVPGAGLHVDGQRALRPGNEGEPPIADGMTRLYHGSATHGRYDGPAWFSTNREYAANYRPGAELQYVDYPTEKVNAALDPDGYGQTVERGFTWNKELDSSETGLRKPVPEQLSVQNAEASVAQGRPTVKPEAGSTDATPQQVPTQVQVEEQAPLGQPVERYLGQYGKGMSGHNARIEANKRNRAQTDIYWRAEPNEKLGYDKHEVVGYKAEPPAAIQNTALNPESARAPEPAGSEPDTGADIPNRFFKKVKVDHDVYIEDERTTETVKVSAKDALASVREDITSFESLLDCLRG